jgi:hypothetical protein
MQSQSAPRRKSSYSANGGQNCLEAATAPGMVLLRDTKDSKTGPVLRVTPADWTWFAASVKR